MVGLGAAITAVAVATAWRWAVGDFLQTGSFITFYPAIAAATLVGGMRSGALAAVLSALTANHLFLPPYETLSTGPAELATTAMFAVVAALLIVLVGLLNEAVDRLAGQAESTRFVLETEPAGVIAVDEKGYIILVNAAIERQLGFRRDELLGKSVEVLAPPELRAGHERLRNAFMANPEPRAMGASRELHAVRKDGSLAPVEVGLTPFHRNGRSGALATVIDISERKAHEWRAKVLSNEVRHRARNLLALVQAVARRTLPREEGARFLSILETLARTQDLMVSNSTAPLHAVIDGELAGFRDQLTMSGCDVQLAPRAAQDFALIVHELSTNALKYGALSTPQGRVVVTGRSHAGQFAFTWEERGGPAVKPPSRTGFGRTILQDLARDLATAVDIDYAAEGFRYQLTADLARIGKVVELPKADAV